ncbi:SMI1/KNR4 family protein [Bacillus sp. RG28]|uniref:SMI1/KNR4 family protein n=1 Tax=Gottfriedia endophytica TaxID=2820819 RepID=A0A940SK67_9BACI|nr:SMI1/KNR4 family protein [Gottfriedia endophytica]MBP0726755.1 SMI1/KNR4 family protein [Gottfriedia endophytica]
MIIEKFGSTKFQEILEFQQNYSIKLPKDYIEFLQEYNGGIVEKDDCNKVFVEDLSTHISIDVLYGLNTGSSTSDIRTWMNKFQEDLLDNSIVIGDDLMHGFIVMVCEGEYSGIYYWDDSYQFEESSDQENTYWIAEDFSTFIKQLV